MDPFPGVKTKAIAAVTALVNLAAAAGWLHLDAEQTVQLNGALGALIALFWKVAYDRNNREPY